MFEIAHIFLLASLTSIHSYGCESKEPLLHSGTLYVKAKPEEKLGLGLFYLKLLYFSHCISQSNKTPPLHKLCKTKQILHSKAGHLAIFNLAVANHGSYKPHPVLLPPIT